MRPARPVCWALALPAALKVAIHLPVLERWGYHGDELYFIDCGRHLAFGYVDHPPLVPWLAALAGWLFGRDLVSLRAMSVLAGVGAVALTGLLARELGGRAGAQLAAGLCVLVAPAYLRMAQMLTIPAFELLWWTLAAYLLARRVRTGDVRLWLAVGGVLGVGLLTKHSTLLWGLGLGVGTLVGPLRRDLRTPWPWAGAGLAALLLSPNLAWQVTHGWPTLEFIRNARAGMLAEVDNGLFLAGQLLYMNPATIPVWSAGLLRLLRRREDDSVFASAFLVVLGALLVTGAKPYYLASAYPPLLAAGSVAIERLGERRPLRSLVGGLACGGALLVPVALPYLSLPRTDALLERALGRIVPPVALTHDLHSQLGWEEQVRTIAALYEDLPPDERARTVLLAGSYAQASAVSLFGEPHGLPRAYSGHMTHHFWGDPPADATAALVWGLEPTLLRRLFADVRHVGRVRHAPAKDGTVPVFHCREPRSSWAEIRARLRRFGHGSP